MVYTGYGNREEQNLCDLLSPASEVANIEQNAQEVRILTTTTTFLKAETR